MEITLLINGKEKTYKAPFISARNLKKTLQLSEKVQSGITDEIMDELAEYEVSLYGNQFTSDELLDGYEASKFFKKVLEDLEKVIGEFDLSVKN